MQRAADAFGHACGVRVQRGRVLKIDRPLAGGFLSLTGPLAPRVVVSPLRAMNIKSALRDLLSVSYGIVSILVISRYAAPPYPAAPDFPPSGGQNKTPQNILFISISTVSTGCCATSKRRKGGGVSHQRENLHRPPGRLSRFYHKRAPSINVRRPPQPSAAKPLSNLRTLGAIAPSNFRTLKPVRACP